MESLPYRQNYDEQLKSNVQKKLEHAKNRALLDSRLLELETQMAELSQSSNSDRFQKEDKIQQEITSSSAVSDTLVEFREVLRQLTEEYGEYGLDEKWAEDLLAHENAHANIAQATGHEWVGYLTTFIKDNEGRIVSIQPSHLTKSQKGWGYRESIVKHIEVLDAPRKYDNKLSSFDEQDIETDKKRLADLEKTHKEEIDAVRKSLGIL